MNDYQMLIGGQWVEAAGGERIPSENPYTGDVWATIPRGMPADVDRAVTAAHDAFRSGPWPKLSATERGVLLRKVADLLDGEQRERLATSDSRDNGKLIGDTRNQVANLAKLFHYFAGLADKVEGAVVPIDKPGIFAFNQWEPLGVVAIITPWNSPLLIASGKLANALAAGCTVVIKPSEFTSISTLEFLELFERAGFPPGVVNAVTGTGADVGEALVTHPKVAKVTFTGGTETGKRINEMAARSLKKVTLELGGKSPNIIFADADLEKAARGAVGGIFGAGGQSCVAGSRLLVQASVYDQVVARLVELGSNIRLGDPLDPKTQMGPVATRPQFERVLSYLEIAREDGAKAVLGGEPLGGKGQMAPPTIYREVSNDMRIAQEEVFGPVLAVIPFADEEDAVRIANDTIYGLASGVWTADIGRALRMAKAIDAGTVWVNMYRASSFMMPFTGHKQSGVGSENGQYNIRNYMQPKSVWVNYGADIGIPFP